MTSTDMHAAELRELSRRLRRRSWGDAAASAVILVLAFVLAVASAGYWL